MVSGDLIQGCQISNTTRQIHENMHRHQDTTAILHKTDPSYEEHLDFDKPPENLQVLILRRQTGPKTPESR